MNRFHSVEESGAGSPLGANTLASSDSGAAVPSELPPLLYGYGDLEPVIDAETMMLHHDKHHRAYLDGLNAAIAKHPGRSGLTVEWLLQNRSEVPDHIRTSVQNMAGGHYNHSLFWQSMTPHASPPGLSLQRALNFTFGSFDRFQREFEAAGTRQFGSGWVYLVATPTLDYGLEIVTFANQDTPLGVGRVGLLACDLWEHAYYLKYRNRRAEWLKAWWDVVDWRAAADRWNRARSCESE
jgi:Fe-Mn family superoxide dismutase